MTRQHKPRRNKTYRQKHVNIPIMGDLQYVFAMDAHGALAALRLSPNEAAFDQLAGIFNVISVGLGDIGQPSPILNSGIRALQDVSDRMKRTGCIGLARHELPPIQNAVVECESLLKKLDVIRLHLAGKKLSVISQCEKLLTPQLNEAFA